uniref:Uncharacterized protein n=1 Tax=Anguilla anguilla TaxID=7936 RepID=A0A0E9SUM9_ANGAN
MEFDYNCYSQLLNSPSLPGQTVMFSVLLNYLTNSSLFLSVYC